MPGNQHQGTIVAPTTSRQLLQKSTLARGDRVGNLQTAQFRGAATTQVGRRKILPIQDRGSCSLACRRVADSGSCRAANPIRRWRNTSCKEEKGRRINVGCKTSLRSTSNRAQQGVGMVRPRRSAVWRRKFFMRSCLQKRKTRKHELLLSQVYLCSRMRLNLICRQERTPSILTLPGDGLTRLLII